MMAGSNHLNVVTAGKEGESPIHDGPTARLPPSPVVTYCPVDLATYQGCRADSAEGSMTAQQCRAGHIAIPSTSRSVSTRLFWVGVTCDELGFACVRKQDVKYDAFEPRRVNLEIKTQPSG